MKNVRQSNFELLRIIAMFMILVIHANMVSLSRPTIVELETEPLVIIMRYFIESLGIVGVNIFVLISGWFLINSRHKKILSLCFQVLVLWGGGFLIMFLTGKADLSVKNILEIIMFTRWDWFVKAYIVLIIISPILNTFVKNSSEKLQRNVIVGFFAFESTYGWIGGANRFFVNGYGPLLFIGLYLLSQYARNAVKDCETPNVVKKVFNYDKKYDLLVFFVCVIINTVLGVFALYSGLCNFDTVYAYTNPFTIIGALYLLLFFSKLAIRANKVVNLLASGSFAVYLIHSQVNIRLLFNKIVQNLYSSWNGLSCIVMLFFFLVIVYIVSVAVDIPRIRIWNKISSRFNMKSDEL